MSRLGTSPSGPQSGLATVAAVSCVNVGFRYTRSRSPSATTAISCAPIRLALPSALSQSGPIGVPDTKHRKLDPLDSFVPFPTAIGSSGHPFRTSNRHFRPSTTGRTHASFPFFLDSQNDDTSGTSTSAKAGFGLRTVRAHSHAITVRSRPSYFFRSGRSRHVSVDMHAFGYRWPISFWALSRIHPP